MCVRASDIRGRCSARRVGGDLSAGAPPRTCNVPHVHRTRPPCVPASKQPALCNYRPQTDAITSSYISDAAAAVAAARR